MTIENEEWVEKQRAKEKKHEDFLQNIIIIIFSSPIPLWIFGFGYVFFRDTNNSLFFGLIGFLACLIWIISFHFINDIEKLVKK